MLTGPDAHEKGMEIRRRLMGAHGEKVLQDMFESSAEIATYAVEYVFGTVWARPQLDLRTRSLCTISALIAVGRMAQLRNHFRYALTLGTPKEDLLEIILHLQPYVGLPLALEALKAAKEAFKEHEAEQGA